MAAGQSEPAAYGAELIGGSDLGGKAEVVPLSSSGGKRKEEEAGTFTLPVRRHTYLVSLQQQVLCSLQGSLALEVCLELWVNPDP